MPKPIIKREKKVIDAAGRSIGRIASETAMALQGKNHVSYEPRLDNGDVVEIRNAAKVKLTGKKLEQKIYYHYSGYPGGMKETQLKEVMARNPAEAIRRAVKNMLPKNRQQKPRLKRLTIRND